MTHTDHLHLVSTFFQGIVHTDIPYVLQDILTPAEIDEISSRIGILRGLKSGKNQRDISAELGISVTTVSRGNRILQYGTGHIDRYL